MKIPPNIYKFLKSRFFKSTLLLIISSIVTKYAVFPYLDLIWWYLAISIVMFFITMSLIESALYGLKKQKFKKFGDKPKMKVFEFGFFICIFIATLYASDIITISHLPNLSVADRVELIRNQFWFIGMYGVALAFGIYHYIFRMDG